MHGGTYQAIVVALAAFAALIMTLPLSEVVHGLADRQSWYPIGRMATLAEARGWPLAPRLPSAFKYDQPS